MNREEKLPLRLLCILAHPDDESLGLGGILAKYGAEGIETYLVTATRGELGWFGPPEENPGPTELGQIREGELKEAAKVLGLREVNILDYRDGELDKADQALLTQQLVGHIRRIRPHVVIPMHFKTPKINLPIRPIDDLLPVAAEAGIAVRHLGASTLQFPPSQWPAETQIWIMNYAR